MSSLRKLWVVLLSVLFSTWVLSAPLDIYMYHDDAPFSLPAEDSDLSREWIAQVNQRQQVLQLRLVKIDRPTLNSMVEAGQPYMILWSNPQWFRFRDPNIQSSDPIFWDADTLVSLTKAPVDYQNPSKLLGLKIGARNGHYYDNLNALFKENKVHRVNSRSSLENYLKLKNRVVDAFIDSRSTILYMQKRLRFSQDLFVSMHPQDAYARHVLSSKKYAWALPHLNRVIEKMNNDQKWQEKMDKWGLLELVNPLELDLIELEQL